MFKHVLLVVVSILALAVIGCGAGSIPAVATPIPAATETPRPLYSFDFEGTCVGQGVSAATPYTPDDGVNKVIIFSREGENESFIEQTIFVEAFPSAEWLPEFEKYEAAELVACMTVTEREFVEECEYTNDNDNTISLLQTHNTTYDITLYEATTGEVVDTGSLYGPSDGCPVFAFFSGDETEIHDGEPVADLIDFLQPYVEP
jgi:hypothetical protein